MIQCPSCFCENPDHQNFCGECGARLSHVAVRERAASYTPPHLAEKILTMRSAIEGERKLVSVLFCDIADSTPLAARVGAEAMHALLNHFFELALAEVHRYEGTINQFLGDGFMALFGAPVAHEDHARRVLLAASGIQQRMRDASGEAAGLREISLRFGVNTGSVVVGKIGDNLRMDYTAIGDTTNLAARLQAFAEPGTIRISEASQRAALAYFEFKSLGKQVLKGIAGPTLVYDLLKVRTTDDLLVNAAATGIRSPLVGRDRELSLLSASIEALRESKGGVVILNGEPGAGKSRLVAEAKRWRGTGRGLWFECRALSFGRNLSYWPFIEFLKGCFGIESSDADADIWSKLEQGVFELFETRAAEIVPYLATVLSLEVTGEYQHQVKFLDTQALRRQVFLCMRQLFERLAQRQPILLVMEDWHWVDQSSVAMCEHLLPLTRSLGLVFWFVTRTDPGEPAARVRAAASRDPGVPLQDITLVPLGDDDSRILIDNLVGVSDLPDAVRNQILRKTEGNPFFTEEVVRALIADGTLIQDARAGAWRLARPVADLALPDNIQGVIGARIDRLDEGVKSVLKLASVIGRNFLLRILEAIAEEGDRVDDGLAQLEAAELIRVRQPLPEFEYIFRHALVQEAAYGSILAERRRAIHRSVATAIESLFADRLDELASQLAYHCALAQDWEKARSYLFKAGDQAGRMAADAEALEHYRQAEASYMKVASRELAPLQRAMLDRKLGQAYFGVGSYDQAVEHFSRALSHLGIRYPRSRAGVRRGIVMFLTTHFLNRLVRGKGHASRPRMDLAVAQEISAICQSLAWLDYVADEERFVLDSLIELHSGEQSGDVLGRVRGLSTLSIALMMFRAYSLARRCTVEALAIASESGNLATLGPAFLARGWVEWVTGSLEASEKSLEQAAAAYKAVGDIRGWAGSTCYLYWVLYQRGDPAALARLGADMVRVGKDAGDPHVTSWGINALGIHALTVGPLDEAVSNLSIVCEMSAQISAYRMQAGTAGLVAKSRLRQGRLGEAATILREAIGLIEAKNLHGLWSAPPFNAFAELCVIEASGLAGAPRRQAIRVARRACRRALRCCTKDALPWLPEAQRLHGALEWLCGDVASAHRCWNSSLATAERLGMPIERARTLLEMGDKLSDASLLNDATRLLAQTGAEVDLAFSLHSRARVEAEAGADIGAALQFYDRAIVALEQVNAEYSLAVACRSRAELHMKLGHLVPARLDLARARICFAAVGAAAEQADLEQRVAAAG